MAIISITFIVLSTVVLTLNTLPYFDKRDENNNERDYPPFALLEAIYMSWFTFEFLVRIYSQNYALDIINCRHLTSFIYKSCAPEVNLRVKSYFTREFFFSKHGERLSALCSPRSNLHGSPSNSW